MSISRWWFVLWLILLLVGQVRVQIRWSRSSSCSRVNCAWGGWSAWGVCNHPCGNAGTQSRSRGTSRGASCGGSSCSGPSSQTQDCNRFCYNGGTPRLGHCDCPDEFWGTCCNKCKYRYTTSYYNPASVYYATSPRRFASQALNFQGFIYGPTKEWSHFYLKQFIPQLSFQRTIELPCVVITYNCPQREQFRTIVYNVTRLFYDCLEVQGQCVARLYYYYVAISRVGFQEAIKIWSGSIKYQGIDSIEGYFCGNVYPEIL